MIKQWRPFARNKITRQTPSPAGASSIIAKPSELGDMDSFEKIELIVNGRLMERKAELDRCKKKEPNPHGANTLYILGIEHEVNMLIRIANDIQAVKENHHSVRDEMVLKMYG